MMQGNVFAERAAQNEQRRARERERLAAETAARHAAQLEEAKKRASAKLARYRLNFDNLSITYGSERATIHLPGGLSIVTDRVDQAQINATLMRMQVGAHHWPDGTLRGFKRLLRVGGKWVSPSYRTEWPEDGVLEAKDFSEQDAVRGRGGIHATWAEGVRELRSYNGHIVELSGYGRCVVGDIGWRSEFARIVRVLM
jgi:hypothetical protein